MDMRTVDFCHAEVILNANLHVKQEIMEILQSINYSWDSGEDPPHEMMKQAFVQRGWSCEVLVSSRTHRRHYFDLFKQRVAIELEFSQRDMFYRDYLRFLLAEREEMIDVGVIITRDQHLETHVVEAAVSCRADIQQARDDLSWLRSWLRTPIWVIGVS